MFVLYTSHWSMSISLLFGLIFISYVAAWIIYARYFHPLRKVPGPFLASISGLWNVLNTMNGDMEYVQRALHQKYGPLVRIRPDEVVCADPAAIQKIYPTQNGFDKTDFYPVWGPTHPFSRYSPNFCITDEKLHAQRRRIIQNVYSMSNVLQCEPYIDKCTQLLMRRIGDIADSKKRLDLGEWMAWYAFDVMGELYYGKMFGFMENSHDYNSYLGSLDTVLPVLCKAAVAPSYWRPFILGMAMFNSDVPKGLQALGHITDAAVNCVKDRAEETQSSVDRRDFIQHLLEIVHKKGAGIDFGVGEVQLESYTAFVAGSDTTAAALDAIFYFLLKHPAVYTRLVNEIDEADRLGQLSETVRYEEAIRLLYLGACVKEGMRLHPPVGLPMSRISPPQGIWLTNTYIAPGYRIGMNAAVVHFDKAVFGQDADKFRPERWLDGNAALMEKHMLAFGAGTRTCQGKNISLSELHKVIPQILRSFRLELAPDAAWQTKNFWFNMPTGLKVLISRR